MDWLFNHLPFLSPVGVGVGASPNLNYAAEAVAQGPTTGDAFLLEDGSSFELLEDGSYELVDN